MTGVVKKNLMDFVIFFLLCLLLFFSFGFEGSSQKTFSTLSVYSTISHGNCCQMFKNAKIVGAGENCGVFAVALNGKFFIV